MVEESPATRRARLDPVSPRPVQAEDALKPRTPKLDNPRLLQPHPALVHRFPILSGWGPRIETIAAGPA